MNRKILVVGGTSGLGKKLAELYLDQGCKVGIIGRRENLLEEIKSRYPAIEIRKADISSPSISRDLDEIVSRMGGMDIFILTASIGEFNEGLGEEIELQTLAVNATGFTRAINFAWQYFIKNGGGQIAAVTSIAAVRANRQATSYNATKAFQSSYLQGLRLNARHSNNNIAVTELMPGYMDTAMGKGERMFWVAPVEKAARQAKKAIDHKKRRAIITKKWWLVYATLKLMPSFLYTALVNGSWKLKRKA